MNLNNALLVFGVLILAGFAAAGSLTVSSVNYDPAPASPGDTVNLWIHVFNDSAGEAKNSVFNINLKQENSESTFPLTLAAGSTSLKSLGTITANQTILVKYEILVDQKATNGTYKIFLETGEDGKINKSSPYYITVLSRKPTIAVISATPTEAVVGKTTSLQLNLKNTGSSAAFNVSVSVSEDRTVTTTGTVVERDIVPLGSAAVQVDYLANNESTTVELPIIINPSATPKAYYIPVKIEFYDENKTKYSDTKYVGLKVVENAEIGAGFSSAEPLPQAGQESKITINIYNIGSGTANYLTAKVQSDILSLEQEEFFIGTLEPDDSDTIILNNALVSSSIQPGVYPITVAFSFKNEFGEETSTARTVSLKVYSAQEIAKHSQQQQPLLLYAVIIIIIAAGVWYFFGRKKKSKKVMA